MKKILPFIIATVLLIGSSALVIAQNHRHNHDDQNAADSLVSEAMANSITSEIETDVNDAVNYQNTNRNFDNNFADPDEDIAKLAIVMVFGTLIVMFIAPVLIVGIILYYVYKRKQSKDRVAMAAIEKGVEIPTDKPAASNAVSDIYNTAENAQTPAKKEKPMMEKGIMKVAIGIGLYCMAKIMHINILGAVALFVAIYGIGQIIIAYISRDKDR